MIVTKVLITIMSIISLTMYSQLRIKPKKETIYSRLGVVLYLLLFVFSMYILS